MKKVLVINIFGIGDVLFTTPLLRNIKINYPQCVIGYVANSRAGTILKNNPDVDKIFIYDRDALQEAAQKSRIGFLQQSWKIFKEIRDQKYEVVFDVSLNGYAGLLMALAGIRRRIGFNFKNRSFFLTEKTPLKGYEEKHVVEFYLDLLTGAGLKAHSRKLEFTPELSDRLWAEEQIKNNLSVDKPLIALVPGGGASWGRDAGFKRWAPERYAQLADNIIEKYGAQIILLGDPKEKELCKAVADGMKARCVNLAGSTTLGQMAALLQRSLLAVVNDGGPLHVAVAVGTKTVSIFGPVDERVYGPYPSEGHRTVTASVPCRPCYRQFRRASCQHISCLGQIEISDVLKNVDDVLQEHEHHRS